MPRIIITSGPTREYMDPVRFISNPSTGKMGYHIGVAAVQAGYETVYICGPGEREFLQVAGAENHPVISTMDMLEAVRQAIRPGCILIMAAAPADYHPEIKSRTKIKKTESPAIRLVANPDILRTVGAESKDLGIYLIGFAAETDNVQEYALRKLREKSLDMIFLNDISRSDSGFGVNTNLFTVFRSDGKQEQWPLLTKEELGRRILLTVIEYISGHPDRTIQT